MIDGKWFVSDEWQVPDMHFRQFAWDSEIDHGWHEFERIEETIDNATEKNDIEDFILLVSKIKIKW